jgi:uncharacterized membrane protein
MVMAMAMTIGVNPDLRKNTNEKKGRKKVKGRNTIRSAIDIVIVIVVMRAVIVTIIAVTIATATILILNKRKVVVEKGIRESIERENADEGPPKIMIQAMTRNPQTLPLMMAIVVLAVIKDAKGGDHLEMKITEAIERKETAERKDGKMKREGRRHP